MTEKGRGVGGMYDWLGCGLLERMTMCYAAGQAMDKNEVLYEQCDVLVPAAIGNVITSDNANKLNCQYVVEAANGPTTPNVSLLRAKGPK